MKEYAGSKLARLAFPLGGIGTGSVSLGGRGNLTDWEIFNRPGRGTVLPYTLFALRAAAPNGQAPLMRVIERALFPPFEGAHGVPWWLAAGLPRFPDAIFRGGFPVASVDFDAPGTPVAVSLEAFSPFIPLDSSDSGLPLAVIEYTVTNVSPAPLEVAIAGTLFNIVGYGGEGPIADPKFPAFRRFHVDFEKNVIETRCNRRSGCTGLLASSQAFQEGDCRYGSLCLAVLVPEAESRLGQGRPDGDRDAGAWKVSLQAHLPRHRLLFDRMRAFWADFEEDGRLEPSDESPAPSGETDIGALCAGRLLAPGKAVRFRFLIAWFFPNRRNIWEGSLDPATCNYGIVLKNNYATRFADAWDVAAYAAENIARLGDSTRAFRDALYSSSLPPSVLDAAGSCLSVLTSNTCFITADGVFHAFEGCGPDRGSCPLDCTHVWNYDQALPHLFPDLARSMRRTDFLNNTDESGFMSHRTVLPLGSGACGRPAAADGQLGSILKLYREWRLSGDRGFLDGLWPKAESALDYAVEQWDAGEEGEANGLADAGEQLNTYDCVWIGANPMIETLYLAALRAASCMAHEVGRTDKANLYATLATSGAALCEERLWNGEYYMQMIPDEFRDRPKQIGNGCLSDQLIGQWFATLNGLGRLLPSDHVLSALKSIVRYNYLDRLDSHPAFCRTYALQDEAGLINCTFPREAPRSTHADENASRTGAAAVCAVTRRHGFFDEVWTGVEYQVAASLAFEGLVADATRIVDAVRSRYDGERRNPWNEIECGDHYARSLAAWSVLLAFSGFSYSASEGGIGFYPKTDRTPFNTVWSCGSAWGAFERFGEGFALRPLGGRVVVREISVSFPSKLVPCLEGATRMTVRLDGEVVENESATVGSIVTVRTAPLTVGAGSVLTATFVCA